MDKPLSQERLSEIEGYMSKRTPIRLGQSDEVVYDTRTGKVLFDFADTEIGEWITKGDANYVKFAVNSLPSFLSEVKRLMAIEQDYIALQEIMDRARKLAFLQAEEEEPRPRFNMDANGNLTRIND
jgi:hypothetical protein